MDNPCSLISLRFSACGGNFPRPCNPHSNPLPDEYRLAGVELESGYVPIPIDEQPAAIESDDDLMKRFLASRRLSAGRKSWRLCK
jgi:hypothetical protein